MISSCLWFTLLALTSSSLEVQVRLGNRILPSQKVELFGFKESKALIHLVGKTSAEGKYRFQFEIENDANIIVSAEFENFSYVSPLIEVSHLPVKPVEIRVYKTTSDASVLRIDDLRLALSSGLEAVHVEEDLVVKNPSEYLVIGKKENADDEKWPESLHLDLPLGAFNLQLGYGFEEKETTIENALIHLAHPFPPGMSHLILSFDIQSRTTQKTFSQKFSLPIDHLSYTTSSKLKILDGGDSLGAKYFDGKWIPVFEKKLSGASELHLNVVGIPVSFPWIKFVPPLFLILLLLTAWRSLKIKKHPSTVNVSRMELKEDLQQLVKLREAKLLSESEFQKKRLRILENLWQLGQA